MNKFIHACCSLTLHTGLGAFWKISCVCTNHFNFLYLIVVVKIVHLSSTPHNLVEKNEYVIDLCHESCLAGKAEISVRSSFLDFFLLIIQHMV